MCDPSTTPHLNARTFFLFFSDASSATLVDRRPDIFSFTFRAPVLIAVITHDDPLSMDSVKCRNESNANGSSSNNNINSTIQTIIGEMADKANHFFKTAAELKLHRRSVHEQRVQLLSLYDCACLRFHFLTNF